MAELPAEVIDRIIQRARAEAIDEFANKCAEWNCKSNKKIPYVVIRAIAEKMKEQS